METYGGLEGVDCESGYGHICQKPVAMQLFTNAAAALPCELEDGKPAERSQDGGNPLQMLLPSKLAMSLRTRMARNRRQVAHLLTSPPPNCWRLLLGTGRALG